jgi:glycosyltransferase involved in cell wall biosynthesis
MTQEGAMTMLSVVIPAYNEEKGIALIMQRVLAIRESLKSAYIEDMELLVVNDGSHDRTFEVASQVAMQDTCIRVLSHPQNRGYGAALKTGFANAEGDFIGFLDADGTYPPEYFPELCMAVRGGSDIVIGSRMMGAESKMPVTRRIGNLFFAGLLTLVGGVHVTDSASGMRVFRRSIYERICPLPDGLNLTPVMSTRAIHENLRVTEVPIPYSERVGRSKLSIIRDGRVFLESILWTALYYNPVRIFGMVGIFGVMVAIAVLIGFLATRISGIQTIGPWGVAALFLALVAGVTGISIFSLGAVFNYLVSLFYKRPIRQGLLGRPILKKPLEFTFGWVGLGLAAIGTILGIVSIALGVAGWEMTRLWLYLVGSAMLILVGTQLFINWILVKILSELSRGNSDSKQDLKPV